MEPSEGEQAPRTGGGHGDGDELKFDPSAVASIIRDGLEIWAAQARRWYERSRDRDTWSPEDVVGDYTNLIEHLTPLAERSIDLTVELLRPWAKMVESRR